MPTNPDTLFQEANCFRCNSNASEADLLELALLDRISTAASSDSTPGLPLTSVQFNDGGVFGGDADLTWNKTTNLLSIVGGISMTAEANETPLTISGYSLTGANAQSMLSLAGTWNTSGTPTAIDLNITDTASNAASLLMNLRTGGGSMFSVSKAGNANSVRFVAGSGTAADPSIRFSSEATGLYLSAAQTMSFVVLGTAQKLFAADELVQTSASRIVWTDGTVGGSRDTGIMRNSAGVVEVNNRTPGTFRDLWARIVRTATPFTVATLPAAGTAGRYAYVTDALAPAYGAAVAGGGAITVPVWDNGAAWITV